MSKTIFKIQHKESRKSKLVRIGFNFFPAYRRTGGRICFMSGDWRDVHVKLGFSWKTRNYVGTVFGGSIYAALDPIYMVQLIQILGKDYVVWDKSAMVNFIKPITKTVYARSYISDEILENIISTVKKENKCIVTLPVHFEDAAGTIYARVEKVLYIADKNYYKNK